MMKAIPAPKPKKKPRANSLRVFIGYDGSTVFSRVPFYLGKDIDPVEPDPAKKTIHYLTTEYKNSVVDLYDGDVVFNSLGLRKYETAELQIKVVKRCQLKPVQRVRSSTSSPKKPRSTKRPGGAA